MSKFIGKLAGVGIGKEVTAGTAVTPTFWLPVAEKNANISAEYLNDESDYGIINKSVSGEVIYSKGEPNFKGMIFDKSFGLLMLAALGIVTTTADSPEAGVNTHVFTVDNDVDHPALTIAFKDKNQDYCIPYSKMANLAINYIAKQFIGYEASFVGQKKETDSNTVAYTSENHFNSSMFSLKLAANVAGLGAASEIDVVDFKLNITKDITEHEALGHDEPAEIFNGGMEIGVEFEMLADNTTYQALFENGTAQAMEINLVNTGVTIGASSNPSLKIVLDKVNLEEMDYPYENEGLTRYKFTGKAHYDTANASAITGTLVNTQTSY